MSDLVISTLISSVAPILAVILAWRSTKKALHEVHLSLNSRLDQFVHAEKEVSRKEGEETGRAEGKK